MELTGHITDLITVAEQMKQQPSVNKKALNKTIARLEEAELWATKLTSGKVNGVPNQTAPIQGSQSANQCTCPDGAIAKDCSIHATTN